MSQECFIQKSISSCRMLFFSQHFPVRPKNILVVYPKILHNLGLKQSILEPLAESHGCLFWSCSSWPFLPEQHTQCQIDSTTKGNKLIFEGLEFLFLFVHYGRKRAECLAATTLLCSLPLHSPFKMPGQQGPAMWIEKGKNTAAEDVNASDSVQIPKLTISMFQNPQQLQAILCKLEKKNRTWWFGGKTPLASLLKKERCRKVWRCSRFNRLTLPAIWHLGCMILRKLEILRKDPFARQWVTMTVTFSRSISRIVHSRINKRSNRNPNFYVSNTSLIRVRFWGQLC